MNFEQLFEWLYWQPVYTFHEEWTTMYWLSSSRLKATVHVNWDRSKDRSAARKNKFFKRKHLCVDKWHVCSITFLFLNFDVPKCWIERAFEENLSLLFLHLLSQHCRIIWLWKRSEKCPNCQSSPIFWLLSIDLCLISYFVPILCQIEANKWLLCFGEFWWNSKKSLSHVCLVPQY